MVPLTEILDKVRAYHSNADTALINRAYVYGARAHDGQKRKSGEPYFSHPVSVAGIITEMNLDTASICAALLHDVVEDTDATEKDIEAEFGDEVAFLVEGVTKLGKVNLQSREDRQAESFRKMLMAMAKDIRVLLVKLADRLDNMRTLHYMSVSSQERIARETMDVYAPLAGRLGIQWLKDELEDLSFKYLHPEAYANVAQDLRRASRHSDRYITQVIKELYGLLATHGIRADISGRMKRPFSVYRKMQQSQVEFEQVHDLLAFRVVVDELPACYAALGQVHARWTPVPGRFKDYIALPKTNMYQSLHTTVIGPERRRIEVQIRTEAMHRTADMGIAAHWQYKERGSGIDKSDADRFQWLRQLMEYQQEVSDPEEFFDGVKVDLFEEEVYVFTPRGDVRTFPRGSTPVDFAYAIHSEIGDTCTGARINGSIVPLRYKLRNGDTVDIITAASHEPSKDWLDFVATARARTRIRGHVRGEERKRSAKLGRDLLEKLLHKRSLSYNRMLKGGGLQRATEALKLNGSEELFSQIGFGRVAPEQVIDAACPEQGGSKDATESLKPGLIEKTVARVRPPDAGIVIGDVNDLLVRFGKCCSPVPGDPITGWITRGRGVTVHRRGCERALELEPERRIDTRWASSSKLELPVTLRVVVADRPGILANISRQFNEGGVNISEATCRASVDGRAVNTFTFSVKDVNKVRTLIRGITKIDGVFEADRV